MRVCHKCKVEKPLSEYYKDRSQALGRDYMCKECKKEYSKTLPDDYRREYGKKYYRENRVKRAEYNKAWREANSDYHAEYMKVYFQDNKEDRMAYNKAWRDNNSEKQRTILGRASSRRRARLAEVKDDLSEEDWLVVLERFDHSCAYCNKENQITIDHVVPISRGGDNTKENVVPACKSCNSSKQARDVEEWYSKQDFYDENNLNKIIEENK